MQAHQDKITLEKLERLKYVPYHLFQNDLGSFVIISELGITSELLNQNLWASFLLTMAVLVHRY